MNTFQYQGREYIPQYDLQVVGSTFSTLEQGHKEAVKTASELQNAIAVLDMNEAEDGFKQSLAGEIDTTVKNHSVYGNAAGALDDLILKSGKIMSDQRVIGRLRAQKDFKAYQAKVDAAAIPDGMKEMYKEENPYYYQDGVDSNGKITSSKWEAKSNPVTTISRTQLADYALKYVQHKQGQTDQISFLDADGKETFDPSKSADGNMYRKVGNRYDILSAKDIKEAYREAIKAIPGAADSLRQDYKYENWKADKMVTKDNPAPVIDGLTDKNGRRYNFDEWNDRQINAFADRNKINNNWTSIEFGGALAARRQAQAAKAANDLKAEQEAEKRRKAADRANNGNGDSKWGTIDVETNPVAVALTNKNKGNYTALNIVKKAGFVHKDVDSVSDLIRIARETDPNVHGPGGAANYYIQHYGRNMSKEDKINLINSMKGYVAANAEYSKMISTNPNYKNELSFSQDLAKGVFSNKNVYSQNIVAMTNDLIGGDKTLTIKMGKDVLADLQKSYKFNNISDFAKIGLNIQQGDDEYIIKLNNTNFNQAPEFLSRLFDAKHRMGNSLWSRAKRWFNQTSDNTFLITSDNESWWTTPFNTTQHNTLRQKASELSSYYNRAKEKAGSAEYNVAQKRKGVISITATDAKSVGELYYRNQGALNGYSDGEIKSLSDDANNLLDRQFGNANLRAATIKWVDNNGHVSEFVNNHDEVADIIKSLYRNKPSVMGRVVLNGTEANGSKIAYGLNFTIPKGFGTEHYPEGTNLQVIVSDFNVENKEFNMSYAPVSIANNTMQIAKATDTAPTNMGTIPGIGNTDFSLVRKRNKNGQVETYYNTIAFGQPRNMNEQQAKKAIEDIHTLATLKSNYENSIISPEQYTIQLQRIALEIMKDYNISAVTAQESINTYLKGD